MDIQGCVLKARLCAGGAHGAGEPEGPGVRAGRSSSPSPLPPPLLLFFKQIEFLSFRL